jgi:four helix bundle protein
MSKKIVYHGDLEVFQRAYDHAMRIFDLSKSFPKEETYSLIDQIRRSSRSVCANLAEAWRKRRYEKAFVSKLSDSEGEAAETQVWLAFAFRCGYTYRVMKRKSSTKPTTRSSALSSAGSIIPKRGLSATTRLFARSLSPTPIPFNATSIIVILSS